MRLSLLTGVLAVFTVGVTSGANAQGYAPGQRVDVLTGGYTWQACTVVQHNVRQGDYEVRCDGRPDTARVPDDAEHIWPATAATQAATANTNAQ